jgi:hypothetical protein
MFIMVGWVAQSVEQRTENPCVGGSIPPPATTSKWFAKWMLGSLDAKVCIKLCMKSVSHAQGTH